MSVSCVRRVNTTIRRTITMLRMAQVDVADLKRGTMYPIIMSGHIEETRERDETSVR